MIALSFAAALILSPASTEVSSFDAYPIQMVIDPAEGPATGSVILVAGTGAFDRDVAFGRSGTERDKLFADLAQRMTRRGLNVARFDRRGVRYGVEDAERLDPNAVPGLTAEAFSRDVEAVYDRVRQSPGRAGQCVVFLAHSEGAAHVAGLAERGVPAPALVLGVGAPMESKVAGVKWQSTGRDADSLLMMDADGDGVTTNAEVEAHWRKTPSGVFGRLDLLLQADGAWTAEDIEAVRTAQAGLYEQTKAAAMTMADDAPYPNAAAPAFSYGWWKSWFTDDVPLAERFARWDTPLILHYGSLDSQVREAPQRTAVEGVIPSNRVRFVSHADRGHSLSADHLFGPMDEAIADQIADQAAAACGA